MRNAGILAALVAAAAVWMVVAADQQVAGHMDKLAEGLFELFTEDKQFPLVLSAAIWAVAFVLLVAYPLLVVAPQSVSLRRLRAVVERCPDERAFAGRFHEISQRLAADRLIGHAWKEFQETLVKPGDQVDVVQNTTRPQSFINFSCAQNASTALRIMPHLPNYFVGVGLLLTFVGLVAALDSASGSIQGPVKEAQDGLSKLLNAATVKFWTSIAGLMSSIVLSFFFRLYSLFLEGEFGSLCHALERRMEFATPQRIFVDVRDTIQEQLAETKKINTEVAMSIADGVGQQFRDHVPGMLTAAVKPLVDAVQESSDRVREGATEGLEELVNRFARTLEGSTSQHLDSMSATLQHLTQSLETTQGSINSSGDEFARRMTEGSERLDASVDGVKSALDQVGKSLILLHRQLERQGSELSAVSERSREVARSMENAANSINAGLEPFQQVGQSLSESTSRLERSTVAMAERIDSAVSAVGSVSGELTAVSQALQSAWESYRERFEGVDEDLEQAFTQLQQAVENQQRIVQEFVKNLDRSFERALSGLSGGIEGMDSTIEGIDSMLEKWTQALERMSLTRMSGEADQANGSDEHQ